MAGVPRAERAPDRRFWTKVIGTEEPSGCWMWTASTSKGYGQFRVGKQLKMAHIWAWEQRNGPTPEGLDLDHQCHNAVRDQCVGGSSCPHRRCVNPDHLALETRGGNLANGIHHYRRRPACKHGHRYTPENTYWWRGTRICRTCQRNRRRRRT